jgi:dTMP kinase
MADRKLDLAETILKKISHGEWVVQDRYEVSTYAYGMMAGISFRQLKKTQDKILDGIYWKPDALFYFDLDPELSIKRLHASGKAIDEFETLSKVKKTRAAYKQILKNKELYHKLFVVDASRPIDEVFREICLRLGV